MNSSSIHHVRTIAVRQRVINLDEVSYTTEVVLEQEGYSKINETNVILFSDRPLTFASADVLATLEEARAFIEDHIADSGVEDQSFADMETRIASILASIHEPKRP